MFNAITLAALGEADLLKIVNPVIEVCDVLVPVLLAVVGAVGAIWCIILGVKYSRAEDPQEHEKAKKSMINAIVGFVLIFVLLIGLEAAIKVLPGWAGYTLQ